MKILIVSHYFIPHIGGIENVVYNQAKMLTKKNHNVTIITSKLANNKDIEFKDGIKIIRIPVNNFFAEKFGIPYPIFSPRIIKTIKNEIILADIVHAHGHVYLPSFISAIYTQKNKKPFFVTQHNTFIAYKNPLFRYLQILADRTIGHYTLSQANKIIVVSNESKKYVNEIIKKNKKIILMYNGVDIFRFKPSKNKQKTKKNLGIPDKFVCLSVRRITFKNGIDTLLHTALKLINNNNIFFLIGGNGPDYKKAQQFINNNNLKNVKLLGFIANNQLAKYYAASDIFILPSKKGEGFPLAVLEAFACGTPVIATRSGGHVEVLKKDKSGYVVNTNDYKSIANRISILFKNKQLMKKMNKITRKLSVDYFSWEKNINQLIKVYRKV
jgi:D-inositol-3-phosphate glycosyltransferase